MHRIWGYSGFLPACESSGRQLRGRVPARGRSGSPGAVLQRQVRTERSRPGSRDARVQNIDAALVAEATITGRVTDATTGSGLGEIEVCAFELTGPEITGCELTEPSGSYAITDLPTGSYKVGFFSESVEEEEKSLGASPFPVQFWKDKPSLETGDALTLGLGVTAGIDAELGSPPPTPANLLPKMSQPLSTVPPVIPTAPPTPLTPPARCRSGRRWKKVKGRKRCVKVHKRRAKSRERLDDSAHQRTDRILATIPQWPLH